MFSKLAKAKDAAPVRPLPSYRGKDIAMMALNKAQAEKIRLFKLNSKTNKPKKSDIDLDYELPSTATAVRRNAIGVKRLTPRTEVRRWLQFQSSPTRPTASSRATCCFVTMSIIVS